MKREEIPGTILEKINLKKNKQLGDFRIEEINKNESKLHLIDKPNNPEEPVVVRNSEIPESSMAAWEFLETYAQTLFPEDVSRRLFGKNG